MRPSRTIGVQMMRPTVGVQVHTCAGATVALNVFWLSATRPGSVACAGSADNAGSTATAASSESSTAASGARALPPSLEHELVTAANATRATATRMGANDGVRMSVSLGRSLEQRGM